MQEKRYKGKERKRRIMKEDMKEKRKKKERNWLRKKERLLGLKGGKRRKIEAREK